MTAEKIFYPVSMGYPDKEREAKSKEFYAKVHELNDNAVRTEYEQGTFYDEETYFMPDGSVWKQMIDAQWMIPYSLELIKEPTGSGTAGERKQQ